MPGSFHQYRLPRGRHGLSRSQVRASQHWRLLGACAEIIAGPGYRQLSVRSLTAEASVSKATFYEHFRDLDECVVATYEMAAENALAAALQVCEAAPDEARTPREGIDSVLDLLEREPALAHVLADGALFDVPGIPHARAKFASHFATLLAASAETGTTAARGSGRRLSLHRVRATIGWLSLRLKDGPHPAISAAAPELTQLLRG